jgi:hypothetical protein
MNLLKKKKPTLAKRPTSQPSNFAKLTALHGLCNAGYIASPELSKVFMLERNPLKV